MDRCVLNDNAYGCHQYNRKFDWRNEKVLARQSFGACGLSVVFWKPKAWDTRLLCVSGLCCVSRPDSPFCAVETPHDP